MLAPMLLAAILTQATPPAAPPAGSTKTAAAPAQANPDQPWPPVGVVRLGAGVTAPRIIKESKPLYTVDALKAGIQGRVVMDVVVLSDGTVGDVRVTTSLDKEYGLDDESVRTVKKWLFSPGKKDGVAVPVLVEIDMTFTKK